MLAAISAATNNHAINILPDMSLVARGTPGAFQPPVAQRDIKAEVIYCVGGVITTTRAITPGIKAPVAAATLTA